MKAQESIQQFCVQEKMTDVDGKPTEGEVKHEDGPAQHPNLLGVRTTSMDVDQFRLEGEVQVKTYIKVFTYIKCNRCPPTQTL